MSKRRSALSEEQPVGEPSVDAGDLRTRLSDLFSAEFDAVYRFCLARTGNPSQAEEAVSDTFADAVRMYSSGREAQVSRAWLLAVARNRVIDQWRSNERHRRRIDQLRSAEPNRDQMSREPQDHTEDHRVLAALRSLPDRQRAALTMRYLDEFSVDEVATTLDVGYRAAESLLARGRRGFIRAYEELR
jgi:RNA polymerase sigma-70 factor (ECF subfamily)